MRITDPGAWIIRLLMVLSPPFLFVVTRGYASRHKSKVSRKVVWMLGAGNIADGRSEPTSTYQTNSGDRLYHFATLLTRSNVLSIPVRAFCTSCVCLTMFRSSFLSSSGFSIISFKSELPLIPLEMFKPQRWEIPLSDTMVYLYCLTHCSRRVVRLANSNCWRSLSLTSQSCCSLAKNARACASLRPVFWLEECCCRHLLGTFLQMSRTMPMTSPSIVIRAALTQFFCQNNFVFLVGINRIREYSFGLHGTSKFGIFLQTFLFCSHSPIRSRRVPCH